MTTSELEGVLEFLRQAERLKSTMRSAYTSKGRQESVAEHTWRLCLMASVLADEFTDVDFSRLIKMCIIHDLGEAIGGDIPAPKQDSDLGKAEQERRDLLRLVESLPSRSRTQIVELWDEYEEAVTPEAKLAKALDKLETILQHNQGLNPSDFDYRFNLEYGAPYTGHHPLIIAIRDVLDAETERRARESDARTRS